jgi:DNA-binding transcriptional LysR family regulator
MLFDASVLGFVYMDIELIRTFIVAANSRTYNEAAEKLFITASTVSKHIQHMECECNITLFERTPHGVSLTEAGKAALPYAEQILKQFGQFISIADKVNDNALRIATLPFYDSFGFAEIMSEFIADHPDIKLTVDDCNGSEVLDRLLYGNYELAFSGLLYLDARKIRSICIQSNEVVAILPKTHALANREQIEIAELRDDLFQILQPVSGVHRIIVDFCKAHGFEPMLGYGATREDSILSLVEKGIGIALLNKLYVETHSRPTIVAVPLSEKLFLDYGLVRLRDQRLSAPAKMLWRLVADKFSQEHKE